MKIIKPVFNVIFLYSSMSLLVIVSIYFMGGLQSLELHFLFIGSMSALLLGFWCLIKYNFGLENDVFDKSVPAKIVLPISKVTIYKFEYVFGLMLYIIVILSIQFTWVIWLSALILSLIWTNFFHHLHVWANDSIDFEDRLRNPEKYKVEHENGVFEYPVDFRGFYYFYGKSIDPANEDVYRILWSEIRSVDASFQGRFTFQEIRLHILTETTILEIDESTHGYLKFFEQLQHTLENFQSLKMLVFMSGEFSDSINLYKKRE